MNILRVALKLKQMNDSFFSFFFFFFLNVGRDNIGKHLLVELGK